MGREAAEIPAGMLHGPWPLRPMAKDVRRAEADSGVPLGGGGTGPRAWRVPDSQDPSDGQKSTSCLSTSVGIFVGRDFPLTVCYTPKLSAKLAWPKWAKVRAQNAEVGGNV